MQRNYTILNSLGLLLYIYMYVSNTVRNMDGSSALVSIENKLKNKHSLNNVCYLEKF